MNDNKPTREEITEALLDIFDYMNDSEHKSWEEAEPADKPFHIYNSVIVLGKHLGLDMSVY